MDIRRLPVSMRVAATAYLWVTGLGYAYALSNVYFKVGITQPEIAAHYHGGTVSLRGQKNVSAPQAAPAASKEEDLNLDEAAAPVAAAPTVQNIPAPSLEALVQEGHTHIFGQTSLFFGVVAIALLLRLSERLKAVLAALPFAAISLDHLGFLATRFGGPTWVFLIVLSGGTMAATHAVITALASWQMWRPIPQSSPEVAHA